MLFKKARAEHTSPVLELFFSVTSGIIALVAGLLGDILTAAIFGFCAAISLLKALSVPSDGGPVPPWLIWTQFTGGIVGMAVLAWQYL